ncbi:MAG: PepSY domain-containing protein [Spirosomataceae bacterium]
MSKSKLNTTMRVYHRYLGFFLAGIMAVYALSGMLLIFRETDFLKSEKQIERTLPTDIKTEELGKALKMRDLKIEKEENGILYFKNGTFNKQTGVAQYTAKELPYILDKMTKLHKASTKQPLYILNIFFGLSLLFFVISSFWMFLPKTEIFKKGLYFTIAGIVLTLILIFV